MLSSGTRLGPYEIVSPLGAGGMGEVYKGRDTRLDRVVAVKVLPAALASDGAFRERFSREARTISQLAHPNICALYDIGESDDTAGFLVMEFLEGETLAARLERGPLKLDDALKTAREIVSALDCAHGAGVVHRDLKPGNVMLTRTGAKLLDFGLAKKAASAVTGPGGAVIQSASSSAVTAEGMIVGTFQYMAPEQLEGAEADARTDIFAFGTILYEMITGRKAFEGKTPVSLISAILKDEPAPVSALASVAPQSLDRLIRGCLAKDPDARFRSAHDLALQLQWISDGGSADAASAVVQSRPVPAGKRGWGTWLGVAAALLAALAAGFVLGSRTGSTARADDTVQFTVSAPEGSVLAGGGAPSFAVSPDGRHVVFVATTPGSSSLSSSVLFIRSLGNLAAQPLAGTERAAYPFWSPDSRYVAFFSAGKLKKINIDDGSITPLSDALNGRGGTWNQDGVIVFAPDSSGALKRIPASGGTPAPASTLDASRGETAHRWPHFLPDGQHFLYQSPGGGQRASEIKVGRLDSNDSSAVIVSETMAEYGDGHLLFWRDGNLVAQPFDPGTLKASGDAVRVAGPVGQQIGNGYAAFAVSSSRVLVHARGNNRPISRLTWLDRDGKQIGTPSDPGEYLNVTLAPDGKQAAVSQLTGTPENRDIWLIDLARSITSRLTSDPADDRLPHWSPDGSRILFGSVREGASGLFVKDSSGSKPETLLAKLGDGAPNPIDLSPDGRFVLYFRSQPKTGFDLMVMPIDGNGTPIAFQDTPFDESDGSFSPDMRWIAYTSNESGREEVYVQPFPTPGQKYRVSADGGSQPEWRADARELFFLAPDGTMMAATIGADGGFEAEKPVALFATGVAFTGNRRQYAVAGDGQRFLVNVPQQGSSATPLTVVLNWRASQK